MKLRITIFCVLLVLSGAIALRMIRPRSAAAVIAFGGLVRESGKRMQSPIKTSSQFSIDVGGFENAAFYVTNFESRVIHLSNVQVQVFTNGSWQNLSSEELEIAELPEPGTNRVTTGTLRSGEYVKILVPPPTHGPWRVSLEYAQELNGIGSALRRGQLALQLKTLIVLKRGSTVWGDERKIFSDPQ